MWKHWSNYLTSKSLCNFILKIRITIISTQGFCENEIQSMYKISKQEAHSVNVIRAQFSSLKAIWRLLCNPKRARSSKSVAIYSFFFSFLLSQYLYLCVSFFVEILTGPVIQLSQSSSNLCFQTFLWWRNT